LNPEGFLQALQVEAERYTEAVATHDGDWIVKGFIDVFRRIYAMPGDTKVVSKILELFLLPKLLQFADQHDYSVVLAAQQNFYPDISFISKTNPDEKYAVDIKSTYRVDSNHVNGMTLGAFTGYFRDRTSRKNTQFPYSAYQGHLVLGVIYSKRQSAIDGANVTIGNNRDDKITSIETAVYGLEDLERISSAIHDFAFFVQPKYRIASARPGSGNTRNIGSVTAIEQLINGTGPFRFLGEEVYDDYWMNYLNADMARKIDSKPPYNNLASYALFKSQAKNINLEQAARLDALDTGGLSGENA
jgi:hypothetical protein